MNNKKEENEVGTVISRNESPNPDKVYFVVTKDIIHKGQFVQISVDSGNLIALVTNVFKTNRYFERADSVKEFESKGSALLEQFPADEWEYLIAETKPLGILDSNNYSHRATFPVSPGTKVLIAKNINLENFFKFDENGLHLGEIQFHGVPVKINLTNMLQKHLAVLAMSGSGKSFGVSCLLEEILDRTPEQGRIGIVVFDPHGEYSSFGFKPENKESADYSDKTFIIKGRNIRIGVSNLDLSMLSNLIPGISSPQRRDLGRIMNNLNKQIREGLGPFDLKQVTKSIQEDEEIKFNTKQALLAWIHELDSMYLFSKIDNPSIKDIIKPGVLTVIDLSDVIDMRKKQIIVSYFSKKIFNARRIKTIPPLLMVFEEAHQFVPQYSNEETSVSRNIIQTIAREGRKFGTSLCLISQRPARLDTTTLSQCGTNIILRITNPNDLKFIEQSSEAIDYRSLSMINSLQVGEAILTGEAVRFPLFFKFRHRKSVPSIHEKSIEDSAKEFDEKKTKDTKEAEEFL